MQKRVGIVRKVDVWGRVVIPKQLRDTLHIDNEVEWFIDTSAKEIIVRPVRDDKQEEQLPLPFRVEEG